MLSQLGKTEVSLAASLTRSWFDGGREDVYLFGTTPAHQFDEWFDEKRSLISTTPHHMRVISGAVSYVG